MRISLKKYAPVISSDEVADEVFQLISSSLSKDEEIVLDFSEIRIISTKCAKRIFGQLYGILGAQAFFSRIIFENTSENIRPSLNDGIESFLSDNGG